MLAEREKGKDTVGLSQEFEERKSCLPFWPAFGVRWLEARVIDSTAEAGGVRRRLIR